MILPDLPAEAAPLLAALRPAFTRPTWHRFLLLLAAALLATGRRTVADLLRAAGPLAAGHPASYRRVLSSASWSGLQLACLLAGFALRRPAPAGRVTLVGDDTVEAHPGRKVHGKARHRDPARSSHSYAAWRYGHKWAVLAVLVRSPFASRPWALPVLVDLYCSEQDDRARRRPPCCTTRCRRRSAWGRSPGRGRRAPPSRTRWRRCGGGCGRSGFSHRRGAAQLSKNSRRRCAKSSFLPLRRPHKLHQSS